MHVVCLTKTKACLCVASHIQHFRWSCAFDPRPSFSEVSTWLVSRISDLEFEDSPSPPVPAIVRPASKLVSDVSVVEVVFQGADDRGSLRGLESASQEEHLDIRGSDAAGVLATRHCRNRDAPASPREEEGGGGRRR